MDPRLPHALPVPDAELPLPSGEPGRSKLLPAAFAVTLVAVLGVGLYLQHEQLKGLRTEVSGLQAKVSEQGQQSAIQKAAGDEAQRQLQARLSQVSEAHENLRAQLAGGAERFADAQRLHAAQYLVLQAGQRLSLTQDLAAVSQLLAAAEQELSGGNDASFARLRKELASERKRLEALKLADVAAIVAELRDLQASVAGLKPLRSALIHRLADQEAGKPVEGWLGGLASSFKRFGGDWFLVRRHHEPVTAPPDETRFRQFTVALGVALAEAQFAALRRDQGWYQTALLRAGQLLQDGLNGGPAVADLQARLAALAEQTVAAPADLRLQSSLLMVAAPAPAAAVPMPMKPVPTKPGEAQP